MKKYASSVPPPSKMKGSYITSQGRKAVKLDENQRSPIFSLAAYLETGRRHPRLIQAYLVVTNVFGFMISASSSPPELRRHFGRH